MIIILFWIILVTLVNRSHINNNNIKLRKSFQKYSVWFLYYFLPRHSWNNSQVGVKHQSIKSYKTLLHNNFSLLIFIFNIWCLIFSSDGIMSYILNIVFFYTIAIFLFNKKYCWLNIPHRASRAPVAAIKTSNLYSDTMWLEGWQTQCHPFSTNANEIHITFGS